MLKWFTTKLQSSRIAAHNIQLAHELQELASAEVATVVVGAIEFCMTFRNSDSGVLISRAIQEPSKLTAADAKELYGQLEDILLTALQQDKHLVARTKHRHGAIFHENFAKRVHLNNMSIRLLLSRISHVFDTTDAEQLTQVSQRLRLALPSIEGAAEALMAEHKALGAAKREDYGTFIRDSAYNYAATYPF